jgi:hypothetical protein
MLQKTLFGALVATLIACGDSTAPEPPRFNGIWLGTLDQTSVRVFAQEDADGVIRGNMEFLTSTGTTAVEGDISGISDHPDISFQINVQGFDTALFDGEWAGEARVRGSVTGSGFNGAALVLEK